MPDALGSIDGCGFAIPDSQDILFRAGGDACSRPDAAPFVHHRVQGYRFLHPLKFCLYDLLFYLLRITFLLAQVYHNDYQAEQDCNSVNADFFYK